MLIDLHAHTRVHSWDSALGPDELVDGARAVGLDGICITEHDRFWPPDDLRRLGARHNFLVLPGAEITTEEGHMLVFGLTDYRFGMHRAAFLRQEAERVGGAVVVAHPYRRSFDGGKEPWVPPYDHQVARACESEAFNGAHGVETLNGRGTAGQNRFARDVCVRRGLPAAAGSDSHEAGDIGLCATEFQRRIEDIDDLISELRAGRFRPVDLRGQRTGSQG